jgi:hypothetical protein
VLNGSSNNASAMPDENDTDSIRSMPSFRYAAQKTHWYDQDDTSLAEHLKRKVRMVVPAQAGSRPPVSIQTPLMHLLRNTSPKPKCQTAASKAKKPSKQPEAMYDPRMTARCEEN